MHNLFRPNSPFIAAGEEGKREVKRKVLVISMPVSCYALGSIHEHKAIFNSGQKENKKEGKDCQKLG